MTGHLLQVRDLSFGYRADRPVLRGVSFSAASGRFLCLLGPNGSGKTTLLKCLLRLLRKPGGAIVLDGRPLAAYSPSALARTIAYVPQIPVSAFAFTVRQIVMLGRTPHLSSLGFETDLDARVVHSAMEMTGILPFADRTLDELSGGEAQCVMIARALAQQPQLLLLDEPTSHLDVKNQLVIYRMMVRLAHDWNMAVVCVSHDINLAVRFADELLLMRDGQVVAAGPPSTVVRADVLKTTYGVDVELIPQGDGPPIVVAH
jgi:iron complex transport system ATP-binding protein